MMAMSDTSLMAISGHVDPLTVARPGIADGITPRADGRIDLIGLARARIGELFVEAGLDAKAARLRSRQVYHWLYHRGVTEFAAMTDIAKPMRPWLAQRFVIGRPQVVEAQHSVDGTRKWLLRTADGHDFEMVFIPDEARGTLCVSSQVGCTLNCAFCHTGTMRLVRNLTAGEIVGQVMLARDALNEWPRGRMDFADDDEDGEMFPSRSREGPGVGLSVAEAERSTESICPPPTPPASGRGEVGDYTADGRLLTNIVMMGMGEPLYNFDNVRDALRLVMDGDGLALSKRRITLSTSGVVPLMARCGEEIGVNLAVSLHAVTKDVRDEIVPINRKYGIDELLAACAAYPGASNARRITFEYVMLHDRNDSDADARELVRLIRQYDLPAKVNLIPFNPWPGAPYECSTPERIRRFSEIVFAGGISAPVRTPRGRDIDAACGQLKTAAERRSRAETDRLQAASNTLIK